MGKTLIIDANSLFFRNYYAIKYPLSVIINNKRILTSPIYGMIKSVIKYNQLFNTQLDALLQLYSQVIRDESDMWNTYSI